MKRVILGGPQGEVLLGKFVVIITEHRIEGLDDTYFQPALGGYFIHHEVMYDSINHIFDSKLRNHQDLTQGIEIAPFLKSDKVVFGSVLPEGNHARKLSLSSDNLLSGDQVEWIEHFFRLA